MKMTISEMFQILREYETGWTIGPTLSMGPDTSGARGKGDPRNFQSYEHGDEFPYDDDGQMPYGQPTGPKGIDRGTPMGSDQSGGPPTPSSAYTSTWDEVEEAMGTPQNLTIALKGGGGMGSNVPGASGGWAHSPATFNFPDEDEVPQPPVQEDGNDFCPMPVPPEPPGGGCGEPAYLKDGTDEDLEGKVDRIFGDEGADQVHEPEPSVPEPADHAGFGEPSDQLFVLPLSGPAGQRGSFGMQPEGGGQQDILQKRSAWDVLAKVVGALAPDCPPQGPGSPGIV